MVSHKQHSLRTMAARRGYNCFLCCRPDEADAQGHSVCPGGVALLVRQRFKMTLQYKFFDDSGYLLVCEVENVLCGTVYRRPNNASAGFLEQVSGFLHGAVRGRQWFLIGDWNWVPSDSLVVHHLLTTGASTKAVAENGSYVPSRWEGSRCIDWVLCSDSHLTTVGYLADAWADHKALQCEVLGVSPSAVAFQDTKTACLSCPATACKSAFLQEVAARWESVQVPLSFTRTFSVQKSLQSSSQRFPSEACAGSVGQRQGILCA